MTDPFNPYAEWLGLANVNARPNHYVLLGLEPFTSDPQQIKVAADRAVTRVRGFRPGDKARFWAALLDELDTARKCLGDDAARRQYDDELKSLEASGKGAYVPHQETASSFPSAPELGNPAMYPPGMGGPTPERYGPAGPVPDNATQQLATSGATGGVSRFAPGYDATAGAGTAGVPQQPLANPLTSPQSIANPLSGPGKVPMGREAYAAAAGVDPMAPVYGAQPWADPMAPVTDYSNGAQPYGANAVQPVYGQGPYASPVYGTAETNPMAPVAMPVESVGYDPSSYGAMSYGSSAYGSTLAQVTPVASAVSPVTAVGTPNMVAKVKEGSLRPQTMMIGGLAALVVVMGGLIVYLMPAKTGQEAGTTTQVSAVDPATPVGDSPEAMDDVDEETPPIVAPEPEPEPTPEPNSPTLPPDPVPQPQPVPTPTPQPEPPPTIPQPEPTPQPVPVPTPEPMPPPEPAPIPPLTPQEKAELKAALLAARQAMTEADLPTARAQLTKAENLARSPEHIALVERTKELEHYVTRFWEAFDKAYAGLQPLGTLTVGVASGATAEAAIVEVRPDTLVIRWYGKNQTVRKQGMPAGLAMAIANTWFSDDSANKLIKGAFYLINAKPDQAQQLWSEAGAAGQPVESLMLVLKDNYEL